MPVQAESRGLSAFYRLHMPYVARRFRVRAGPFSSNAAPSRSPPLGGRERARHQPRPSYRGVTGRSPVRRGSRRQRSGSGSGEGFPLTSTAFPRTRTILGVIMNADPDDASYSSKKKSKTSNEPELTAIGLLSQMHHQRFTYGENYDRLIFQYI